MKCACHPFLAFCLIPIFVAAGLAGAPTVKPPPKTLPMTKLAPAKLVPNLCLLKYRVTTSSAKCQAFVDQGLAYFYSYVWMEAARSYETATHYDPNCAMAWWGLSRAIERWGRGQHAPASKKAQEFLPRVDYRGRLLITARLQETGIWPNVKPEARRSTAAKTLDELLM